MVPFVADFRARPRAEPTFHQLSIDKGETGVVINTAEVYPGDFTRNADFSLPAERVKRALRSTAGEGVAFIDATGIATTLMGNSIAANMFMLGFAWQQGLVPCSTASRPI